MKERVGVAFEVVKTVFHWGFIPAVLYLGFSKGAEAGMPPLSIMKWVGQNNSLPFSIATTPFFQFVGPVEDTAHPPIAIIPRDAPVYREETNKSNGVEFKLEFLFYYFNFSNKLRPP